MSVEAKKYENLPVDEREAMLEANCYNQEEMPIQKHFSEDEINEMRKTHVANSIAIKRKSEEFKKLKAEIDAFIKPLAEENNYLLQNVRAGYVEVNKQVYIFDDQETSMMNYYDNTGELVYSRRMMPHEKQLKIK
jgi:peptidoglycan hydrolase CwlO-like protein